MTDRLKIASLNVQDRSAGYWIDIVEGGPADAVRTFRGERVLIPGAPGFYTPAGAFEAESLPIKMHGAVWGVGLTALSRRVDYRANMDALLAAAAESTRADVVLTALGPYVEGLDTGESATISAGFTRLVGPPALGWELREFDLEFLATSTLSWTVT